MQDADGGLVAARKAAVTWVVYKDRLENINEVPGWPVITVKAGATTIRLPDILVR